MKLLQEYTQNVKPVIEESRGANPVKSYFLEGPYMQAEIPNKNGRNYPRGILENEIARYAKIISEKRSLGELGHPDSPAINLDRASHLITQLRFEGNNVIGRAKILDTPLGKIVKTFIDEGVRLGVSSRGVGSLKSVGGINEVQSDFMLSTVDIVADPSGPDCFVQGIMEDAEWIYEERQGWIKKDINAIIKETKYDKSLREEKLFKLMNTFLSNLSNS